MCVKNVCENVHEKWVAKMYAKNVQGLFICGGRSGVEETTHKSEILHSLIF